jgi:hypothetical protein
MAEIYDGFISYNHAADFLSLRGRYQACRGQRGPLEVEVEIG